MRDFTPEEKELIINTPITIECFDFCLSAHSCLLDYISYLESERKSLQLNLMPKYFDKAFAMFVAMLPNSYKVVKL